MKSWPDDLPTEDEIFVYFETGMAKEVSLLSQDPCQFAYVLGYIDGMRVEEGETADRFKRYPEYHKGFEDGQGDLESILERRGNQ